MIWETVCRSTFRFRICNGQIQSGGQVQYTQSQVHYTKVQNNGQVQYTGQVQYYTGNVQNTGQVQSGGHVQSWPVQPPHLAISPEVAGHSQAPAPALQPLPVGPPQVADVIQEHTHLKEKEKQST